MNGLYALVAVLILVGIAFAGAESGLHYLFGVIIPYLAIFLFVAGFIYRVMKWIKSPVPFKITTTCGQQKSLPWIKANNLEAPHNKLGVLGRLFLEVFCFRSLFRNTKTDITEDSKVIYGDNKWLWAAGLAFHYSFLVIVIRHFRFVLEPVPYCINLIEYFDSFFQIGLPILYITDGILLAAVGYLFLRRIVDSRLRYISLASDYFPLFLILGIGITGVLMRYFPFGRVDVTGIKELAMGLVSFSPVVTDGIGVLFYIHLFLVCVLFAYFPFSKLMHAPGVFLSPTRNMTNDNRIRRHINPCNPKVKLHTYAEYEDEFRDVMKAAGMRLEKEE